MSLQSLLSLHARDLAPSLPATATEPGARSSPSPWAKPHRAPKGQCLLPLVRQWTHSLDLYRGFPGPGGVVEPALGAAPSSLSLSLSTSAPLPLLSVPLALALALLQWQK